MSLFANKHKNSSQPPSFYIATSFLMLFFEELLLFSLTSEGNLTKYKWLKQISRKIRIYSIMWISAKVKSLELNTAPKLKKKKIVHWNCYCGRNEKIHQQFSMCWGLGEKMRIKNKKDIKYVKVPYVIVKKNTLFISIKKKLS